MKTTFELIIDGKEIPAEAFETVEQGLTDLLLAELAKLDNNGDRVAEPLPTARDLGGDIRAGRFVPF
jgi:hypothetical protein